MSDEEIKRGPGRPRMVREEDEPQERRRRAGDFSTTTNTLTVPESILDRDKYEYRWISDEGVRLYNLTVNDDYDVVTKEGKKASQGDNGYGDDAYRVQSGIKADGSGAPLFMYLCRKPKKWAEADRNARRAQNDDVVKAKVKSAEQELLADKGHKISDRS